MEDDLNVLANRRQPHAFVHGRQLQNCNAGKITTISRSGKPVLASPTLSKLILL